ncbi:MAG: beta domain, partial [Pseudomonadota bacterium]
AWDYRLKKHTQVAVIAGEALGPKPAPMEPEPAPVVPQPETTFAPMASPLDGGLNCSRTSLSRGDISVQNLTQRTLQPVWIGYDCEPQWQVHPEVAPGGVFIQSTFGTHVFQFYDVGTFELISELTLPEPLGPFYAATIEQP